MLDTRKLAKVTASCVTNNTELGKLFKGLAGNLQSLTTYYQRMERSRRQVAANAQRRFNDKAS